MPPENRLAVASVTTKLFTPVLVMAIPLNHPSAPPKANVAAIASGMGRPQHLKKVTGEHDRTDADRADREVHATSREDYHLGETHYDVHRH